MTAEKPIKIAITAMGGQGGGVLSSWIVQLAERAGYFAQYTSVPGVAQRTGATVYYVEIFPGDVARSSGKHPVLALMPVPGDVDIVIASEMMEAGRALQRGFVTDKTTFIASHHRVYAISEKIKMEDGRGQTDKIAELGESIAANFICADMDALATRAGSVISSVLFGALAGSAALPFERAAYEETIKAGGKAVEANLKGFDLGYECAFGHLPPTDKVTLSKQKIAPASSEAQSLLSKMELTFPAITHYVLKEGLKKAADYQDLNYADLYLQRMEDVLDVDKAHGGERRRWELTIECAKYLALAMSYEDTIRVADLKTRKRRFDKVEEDIHLEDGQIYNLSEYFHPRLREICDILPHSLASRIMSNAGIRGVLEKPFQKGRRVSTTKLTGFLMLSFVASMRPMRRSTYRYALEEESINEWLEQIKEIAQKDYALACSVVRLRKLIKGYGDTHERGLRHYTTIFSLLDQLQNRERSSTIMDQLTEAALMDEEGQALKEKLAHLAFETQRAA